MARAFAFLRAVNVGGRTVKMDQLRAVLASAGLTGVETFIASGNLVCDAAGQSASLERKIETALRQALGYEVTTFVRSGAQLAALVTREVFPAPQAAAAHGVYVAFLKQPAPPATQDALRALAGETEWFEFGEREVHWLSRVRFSESPFAAKNLLEKTLGGPATVRNTTTLRKLAGKYGLV